MNADHGGAHEVGPDTSSIVTGTVRHRWRGTAIGIAVVAAPTVATVIPLVLNDHRSTVPVVEKSRTGPLQRWWAGGHAGAEALQATIHDVQHGLAIRDSAAVAAARQWMHDVGDLTRNAPLPARDPDLTSVSRGAIEDTHTAAHMCLAAEVGSLTDHGGEFRSDLAQAERQLQTAQAPINRKLTAA